MTAPDTCHFVPGQLVECIDDDWTDELGERPSFAVPVSGCIYTIAESKEYLGGVFLGFDAIGSHVWFSWLHFRPVQTPSIDCFRSLLAPMPSREVEPA